MMIKQTLEVFAEGRPLLHILQGKLHKSAEVSLEVADVVALLISPETYAKHFAAVLHQQANGIGDLDLAVFARRGPFDGVKNRRRKYVARGNGEVAGRFLARGLFDQVFDFEDRSRLFRLGNA